jgi:hypothetical protein
VYGTKISLSGELASCGMEVDHEKNNNQQSVDYHCCDNVVSAYSIGNDYCPSSLNFAAPATRYTDAGLYTISDLSLNEIVFTASISEIKPPGNFNPNSVDLPVICIYRI